LLLVLKSFYPLFNLSGRGPPKILLNFESLKNISCIFEVTLRHKGITFSYVFSGTTKHGRSKTYKKILTRQQFYFFSDGWLRFPERVSVNHRACTILGSRSKIHKKGHLLFLLSTNVLPENKDKCPNSLEKEIFTFFFSFTRKCQP
jgi:hypothetical protein